MNEARAEHIAQVVAMRDRQRDPDPAANAPHPIAWPTLNAREIATEWHSLRTWVVQLRTRYPNAVRIPECWWRHNDLVEALSALRDYERACFRPAAPATAAVEWHRAFRDIEARMETWIKRFTCGIAGRGHDVPSIASDPPEDWAAFVEADRRTRKERASSALVVTTLTTSPTSTPSEQEPHGGGTP